MAQTTPSDVANFLTEVMASQVSNALTESAAKLAMIPDYSDNAVHMGGDDYVIKKLSGGSAKTRSAGGTVTDSKLTYGKATVTTAEIYDSHVYDHRTLADLKLSDIENDVMYSAEVVAQGIMTNALSALVTGASANKGTINTAVNQAALQAVRNTLSKNKVPQQPRYLIVDPDTMQDISNISEYQNAFAYAGTQLSGEYLRIEGLNMFESALLPTTTTGHINLAFHPRGVGQVFIPQVGDSTQNSMKAVANIAGIPAAIMWEKVEGTNGGFRLTVSCIHGAVVVDSAAVLGLYGAE